MPAASYPPLPHEPADDHLPRFGGVFSVGRLRVGGLRSHAFGNGCLVHDAVRIMMLNVDHFTPLSRAVASIDRDSYAARFAVYEREHKALLRRLATASVPCSDADVAREERAFR